MEFNFHKIIIIIIIIIIIFGQLTIQYYIRLGMVTMDGNNFLGKIINK